MIKLTEQDGHFYLECCDGAFLLEIDKVEVSQYLLFLSYKNTHRGTVTQAGRAVTLRQAKELGIQIIEES